MQLNTIFIFLPKGGLPPVSTDWSESTLTIVDFESHAASVEVCFDSRMKYELYMISSDRKAIFPSWFGDDVDLQWRIKLRF